MIEIKHLYKTYKDIKAVDDLSMTIKTGQLFAMLGLNGAGKSTTINILVGAIEKDSGEIFVDGQSIDKNIKSISHKIGIVFQNSVLDRRLTVLENLKYRAGLYDLTKEEFNRSLNFLTEKLELKDILKRPLDKLSGGQKRRVDIARALIHNPVTRRLVWDLIGNLRKEKNLTVILTTHYMEEAVEADYVVIMDSGKIVAEGTPIELKNRYSGDFVNIYQYKPELEQILEKSGLKWIKNKDFIVVEFENTQKAKDFIVKNSKLIIDLEIIKGKMDNVFLNVTGKNLKEGA